MLAITVDPKIEGSISMNEIPVPVSSNREVLVEIKASALNHRDLYVNKNWGYLKHISHRIIAGGDGAGIIKEVGSNVKDWNVGDEVIINPLFTEGNIVNFLGGPTDGTFAEYISVPSHALLRKPDYLSFEEAAAIPLALSTAWGTIVTQGRVKEGETILIQGIGSGVALFNLQLALKLGAKVIVTSSSDQKISRAMELGAISGINYKTEDVSVRVREITNGAGVDVVIDSSGKNSITSSIQSLSENGRLLWFGSTSGNIELEKVEGNEYFIETGMVSQAELEDALTFYTRFELKPILSDTIYSFKDFKKAYKELEEARQFGKIVMKIEK